MRIRHVALPLLASVTTMLAQPVAPAPAAGDVPPSAVERAIDALLSERESPKEFDAAIDAARKAGVSEQAILEARFLYHVDRGEDAAIAALLPEFLKRRDDFKVENSAAFGVKEDWLAVIEYVEAIAALGASDKAGFKHHITEAFWLSPRQAAAFAPHIERMRLEEQMRDVKLDFAISLAPVVGEAVSLEKLIAGKKALLLQFWSPRSRECEASLPDFAKTADVLAANGIGIASLLPDDSAELLTAARGLIHSHAEKAPGAWLIDHKEKPLARELRIQNLPTMVLISPEGKVLFNGDPTDDEFWKALGKIEAKIGRPAAHDEN